MSAPRGVSNERELFDLSRAESILPTDGEISFLWSFIQGSIMIPETWNALHRSYGFCERHAWIHISVEMAFRDEYLLGPTILYCGLINKSLHALNASQLVTLRSVIRRLRAASPCLLCSMKVKGASAGVSSQARLDQGRDGSQLRNFASRLEPIWRGLVCPECSGQQNGVIDPPRCRQHLVGAMKTQSFIDIMAQRNMLQELFDHLSSYQRSFVARGPKATDPDRAALISAIGWCNGWRPLLAQLSWAGS